MRYTHILFDLDGTLTDPKPGIFNCIRHALVKMGREAGESDSWERYIGPPCWTALPNCCKPGT